MNGAVLEDRELEAVLRSALHICGSAIDMEPLGKEQVDLVDVLLEGGVAGGVVRNVIGGAQTFVCVEGDFGGFAVCFAARGMLRLGEVIGLAPILKAPIGVLLAGEKELGQMLPAQDIEDKDGEHERRDNCRDVEDTAEAFPPGSLGVKEYLSIGH